jgi:sporulation protein YlmC with PRC-barrel domain
MLFQSRNIEGDPHMLFEPDPHTEERDRPLIASDRVEGTPVINRDGERLGTIRNFMVGKRDGKVRYAVMSFGGLFGLGERYYPLPWEALSHDNDRGGYVVDLDKERLENAPSFDPGEDPVYDEAFGARIENHWRRQR